MLEIKNNIENKNVTLSFILPYKKSEELRPTGIGLHMDILGHFSDHCIKALTARLNACAINLFKHKDSIIQNDGYYIVYKRDDGTIHSYNIPSATVMKDGIKALKMSEYKAFLQDGRMVDQLLKALYWIERPEDKKGAFKYSDLISILMGYHKL